MVYASMPISLTVVGRTRGPKITFTRLKASEYKVGLKETALVYASN